MKNILIILIAFTLLTCKKKSDTPTTTTIVDTESVPVANFSTDKVEYDAGDVIKLTSTSSNADNVRWTLPDGTTSRDASVSYPLDPLGGSGKLNIKLEAISKSGTKSDYIVKAIKVNPGKGKLTIYSSFYQANNVSVSIDGVTVSSADFDPANGVPSSCVQPGYSTYTVNAGVHVLSYSYFGGQFNFSGTKNFTMTTGGCLVQNCN